MLRTGKAPWEVLRPGCKTNDSWGSQSLSPLVAAGLACSLRQAGHLQRGCVDDLGRSPEDRYNSLHKQMNVGHQVRCHEFIAYANRLQAGKPLTVIS